MKTIISTGLIIILFSLLTSCSFSEGLEEGGNSSTSSYSSEGGNIGTRASSSTAEKSLVEKRSRGGVSSQKSQTNESRKGRQKTDSTTRAS